MKSWLLFLLPLALASCAAPATYAPQPGKANYPDLGAAPELVGDTWLNTAYPLRLSDLRGKVVIVDMWTFG
jgi:hypothetical protein